jgi:hypothetical protein
MDKLNEVIKQVQGLLLSVENKEFREILRRVFYELLKKKYETHGISSIFRTLITDLDFLYPDPSRFIIDSSLEFLRLPTIMIHH